ncbi:hypothetical protein Maes01_00336 [Microbulbifer aestuariivivens]|uniref:DUF1488 family protein n=1 Tax=Microbulbifer aestuariivivens TaxID=1908308 RepID=A0ABP9WKQ7_9GAMM
MSELLNSNTTFVEIVIANQRNCTAVSAVRQDDQQLLWQMLFDDAEEALEFATTCRTIDRQGESPLRAQEARECEIAV